MKEKCSECSKEITLVESSYNEGMCKECYVEIVLYEVDNDCLKSNKNFDNVIEFLKVNKYGFYPPVKSTEELYYYLKAKGLEFSVQETKNGFYKFELNGGFDE